MAIEKNQKPGGRTVCQRNQECKETSESNV